MSPPLFVFTVSMAHSKDRHNHNPLCMLGKCARDLYTPAATYLVCTRICWNIDDNSVRRNEYRSREIIQTIFLIVRIKIGLLEILIFVLHFVTRFYSRSVCYNNLKERLRMNFRFIKVMCRTIVANDWIKMFMNIRNSNKRFIAYH